MPGPRPNPTASRRVLAARLRRMRLAAGKSSEDAARELMASPSKISRLENGERAPQPRDVRDLARFYGATEDEIDRLQELVSEARKRGWWESYDSYGEQSDNFYGLETMAKSIDMFDYSRWPGLLQTSEMTRALLARLRPEGEFSEGFVEDQVVLRGKRQERLLGGEMTLHVILDESMFRRGMGAGVVERQVARILELSSDLRNLTLQVVPFATGSYPGLDGSFHILGEFEDNALETTVFVEGLLGHSLVDQHSVVVRYRRVFASIAQESALDPDSSRRWMSELLFTAS